MQGWGLFSLTTSVFLVGLLGCGGDQRSGSVPADSAQVGRDSATGAGDTAGMTSVDTTAPAAKPETTSAAPTPAQRDTTPKVAAKPAPRAKPPAAAPRPRRDTTASQPAETTGSAPTQTAEASAPMRDPYHRAPLDTVSQQVYDGWKQFNLNCARCHGEDVQGTTIAPHLIVSLRPDGPINTKELFVQTVCAGRPAKGMPAWCALGMEMPTIEAIYSYVKGRSDAKIHPGRPALKPGG